MADTDGPKITSNFLKFSDNSRLHMSRYGSSRKTDSRVIITALDGELAMVLTFDSPDEAELELISIGEQIDVWEAANSAKLANPGNRRR